MMVVVYGLFTTDSTGYLVLIVVATVYKWWWDVVMDWGLMTVWPAGWSQLLFPAELDDKVFLRRLLMYPSTGMYYLCVALDLGLRFLWIVSLVPSASELPFVNPPALSVLLGSMEIFRR
jgi:hypothetical protein